MKAIVYKNYGSPAVLQMEELSRPVPKDFEILIKVKASAVNSGDVRIRKADPFAVRLFFGLVRPKKQILGAVFSGEVEAIGKKVTRYKIGDIVFGSTGMGFGAHAEYKCLPQNAIIDLKPTNLSHREAAVIPFGGHTALYFLQKASVTSGQKVLIIGASGAVGTAAVQLAKKHFGAIVTGVCSTQNLGLVKSLGADKVIDYTTTDFTSGKEKYDVIFDTVGKISSIRALESLTENGTLILANSGMRGMIHSLWNSMTKRKKVVAGVISETAQGLHLLKALCESGTLKPVIDRTYPLEQVDVAHGYVEKGRKKGNVAIQVSE